MAEFARKVLWVTDMGSASAEKRVLDHAKAAGIDGIAIRTTSERLPKAIAKIKSEGFKVYAWRWPAVVKTTTPHYFAPDEAEYVAKTLIPAGIDGYIVDPESDKGRDKDNWNQKNLENLASNFCSVIAGAANSDFVFGLTSGCTYPTGLKRLPWSIFVEASNVLLPQTYWRAKLGKPAKPKSIHGGTPQKSISVGLKSWKTISKKKTLIPMAGEINLVTAEEINEYAKLVRDLKLDQYHFYADAAKISNKILDAIKSI